MFGSLDYIYVPAADVDGEAVRYVETLGAELVWKVRGMGTTVTCLRVSEPGPAILLSGHLEGASAILVYRVQDYAATVARLRERNVAVHELEIPHGPCATFTMEAGSGARCTSSCVPGRFTSSTAVSTHDGECVSVLGGCKFGRGTAGDGERVRGDRDQAAATVAVQPRRRAIGGVNAGRFAGRGASGADLFQCPLQHRVAGVERAAK